MTVTTPTLPYRLLFTNAGTYRHQGFNASRFYVDRGFSTIVGSPALGADSPNAGNPTIYAAWAASDATITAAQGDSGDCTQTGCPYASGCIIYDGDVYWKGCVTRRVVNDGDPNNDYSGEEIIGSGHGYDYGSGSYTSLDQGGIETHYQNGQITDWSPSGQENTGSCASTTYSIAYRGVELSSQTTKCPSYIKGFSNSLSTFNTEWDGGTRSNPIGTGGVDGGIYPEGSSDGFHYYTYGKFHDAGQAAQ